MKKAIYPLLGLVVAGVFFLWWFSASQVVKRKSDRLLELISFEKGSGIAGRQSGGYAINALLAQEVELSSDSHPEVEGMYDRDEMESAYAWFAGRVVQSSFERVDFKKVEIREPVAEVEMTVNGVVELPGSKPLDGRHDVFLLWMHDGTDWRLAHARWQRAGGE